MVRFIIILAILILALSFFGISIRGIVESPTGQDNFTFVWHLVKTGWHILVDWTRAFIATVQGVIPG